MVFTHPNVAAVGFTEAEATERGLNVGTYRADLGSVAGSVLRGEGFGGIGQLVVDTQNHTIVGATFVGTGAGEHPHAATIAIVGELPIETLLHAVPAFPTQSEIWLDLLAAAAGRPD